VLRRDKAEILRLQDRYQALDRRNQPIRDAAEMARVAEQLGQGFEARAFLTVAIAADPGRDDLQSNLARLERDADTITRPGLTLAEVASPKLGRTPAIE
jgi:hypothetical protein